MPKWINKTNAVHVLHGAVIVGGAVELYLTHRITSTQLGDTLIGYAAFWSGVGGATILGGSKVAATTTPAAPTVAVAPPAPATPAPAPIVGVPDVALVAPVAPLPVAPSATQLGPEHGAPVAP